MMLMERGSTEHPLLMPLYIIVVAVFVCLPKLAHYSLGDNIIIPTPC